MPPASASYEDPFGGIIRSQSGAWGDAKVVQRLEGQCSMGNNKAHSPRVQRTVKPEGRSHGDRPTHSSLQQSFHSSAHLNGRKRPFDDGARERGAGGQSKMSSKAGSQDVANHTSARNGQLQEDEGSRVQHASYHGEGTSKPGRPRSTPCQQMMAAPKSRPPKDSSQATPSLNGDLSQPLPAREMACHNPQASSSTSRGVLGVASSAKAAGPRPLKRLKKAGAAALPSPPLASQPGVAPQPDTMNPTSTNNLEMRVAARHGGHMNGGAAHAASAVAVGFAANKRKAVGEPFDNTDSESEDDKPLAVRKPPPSAHLDDSEDHVPLAKRLTTQRSCEHEGEASWVALATCILCQ